MHVISYEGSGFLTGGKAKFKTFVRSARRNALLIHMCILFKGREVPRPCAFVDVGVEYLIVCKPLTAGYVRL